MQDYFVEHPLSILPAAVALGALAVSVLATARRGFSPPTEMGSEGVEVRAAALFGGAVSVGVASVVVVGGDHFQGHRFLQAYLPLLAVPMAVTTARLTGRAAARTVLARVVGALAILLVVLFPVVEWAAVRRHAAGPALFSMALQGRAMGAALSEPFGSGPYPELGVWMAGGTGYEYPGPVKDLLGLNWVAMGHSPGNRNGIRNHAAFNQDVFWSAPPDLMLPEPEALILRSGCTRIVLGGVLKGLLLTERFRAKFERVRVRSEVFEPLVLYAKSDWVPTALSAVEPLGWSYCDDPRSGSSK